MNETTVTGAAVGVVTVLPTPTESTEHFRRRLAFETDASDVAAELGAGAPGFVVVDSRSDAAWAQGRVPGAVHLPTRRIADEAAELIPAGTPVVVYCWSPGCNGGTKAALALSLLGYPVKEMLGGFEYWAREGYAFETDEGVVQLPVDALTGPASGGITAARGSAPSCGC